MCGVANIKNLVFLKFLAVDDDDDEMEDVASSPAKSPVAKTPPKSPVAKSPVPIKDPEKEAQDQIKVRIAGAVALVAAEYSVSVAEVQSRISVELGYKFAQENNVDLFETLKNGYGRCVTITRLVHTLAKNVGVDFNSLVQMTDWLKVYDGSMGKSLDPLTEMTKYFQKLNKQEGGKPKRTLTEKQEERLSAFKIDPDELKASRDQAKQKRENKARERKVDQARKKGAKTVDDAAEKQLDSDEDDDDDDISISDMMN